MHTHQILLHTTGFDSEGGIQQILIYSYKTEVKDYNPVAKFISRDIVLDMETSETEVFLSLLDFSIHHPNRATAVQDFAHTVAIYNNDGEVEIDLIDSSKGEKIGSMQFNANLIMHKLENIPYEKINENNPNVVGSGHRGRK